jgi:hypothetical protein
MSRGGARPGAGRPKGSGGSFSAESLAGFRAKIQTNQILQRLHGLVRGEIEMPPHAVTAALGLLRKVLPDVAQIEHSGEVTTVSVIRAPEEVPNVAAWRDQHAPAEQTTQH